MKKISLQKNNSKHSLIKRIKNSIQNLLEEMVIIPVNCYDVV